jgi:ferredoxin
MSRLKIEDARSGGSTKITIDKNLCIGCGTCVAIAPKSFRLSDEGKAEVVEPPGDNEAMVKEAIDSCPVAAIKSAD